MDAYCNIRSVWHNDPETHKYLPPAIATEIINTLSLVRATREADGQGPIALFSRSVSPRLVSSSAQMSGYLRLSLTTWTTSGRYATAFLWILLLPATSCAITTVAARPRSRSTKWSLIIHAVFD